jgi:hypothetical protein
MGGTRVVSSASSSSDPRKYVENDKELFMNNQTSVSGGASPELQPTIDPPSSDTSGQAPPVVALTNPSPAPEPDGVKVPHVIEPDGVKVPHV